MSQKFHSRFVKPPRHPFDIERIRQTTEAVNASRNLQIYVGQKAAIHQSDSNTLIELPPNTPKIDKVSNFQIYNIANATDSSKNNFTFQIRPGIIGFRPAFIPPGYENTNNLFSEMVGNWEFPLIGTGTDNSSGISYSDTYAGDFDSNYVPTPNSGGSVVVLPNTGTATLITSTNPNAESLFVQIEVEQIIGSSQFAHFWVLIKENSTDGCYTELWGANNSAAGAYNTAFPEDAQVNGSLPIGFVFWANGSNSSDFLISQIQIGNAIGNMRQINPLLIPHGAQPSVNMIPQSWRGKYSEIPSFTYLGSEYKIFYPGDVVVDDSTMQNFYSAPSGTASTKYYTQYIFTNNVPQATIGCDGGVFLKYGYSWAA